MVILAQNKPIWLILKIKKSKIQKSKICKLHVYSASVMLNNIFCEMNIKKVIH